MASKYWLVGKQGSGKTTVAVALAALHSAARNAVCAMWLEGGWCVFDAKKGDFFPADCSTLELNGVDVLFIEASPTQFDPTRVAAGDSVMFLHTGAEVRAKMLAPQREVAHG